MIDSRPHRILDVCNLPAPEPMVRILEVVATLYPGETLFVTHNRIPHLLYPRLKERGLEVETEESTDGGVKLKIRRPH
ncbi:MAG: DUF2249 domain-containing protein [Magnetococcales bacterium]|nr:DUF2249 domain-containing protein [Magnetococcales bacterium]